MLCLSLIVSSQVQQSLQSETAALQKLTTTTEYELRQLRTASEAHEFNIMSVTETAKQSAGELQVLQQQGKAQEMDVHKLMATSKYHQLRCVAAVSGSFFLLYCVFLLLFIFSVCVPLK